MRGLTVALIGPDGAGKSTIGRRLVMELGVPAAYIYMGVNLEASRLLLPHTRLYRAWKRRRGGLGEPGGPPDSRVPRRGGLKGSLRSWARVANLLAEEWFRQFVVWSHRARGRVVLCDRHFIADYFFHDMQRTKGQPMPRRLHGWVLQRWYPRPDLLVCLDAPSAVVHARKPEGSPEALERRRREYLELERHVPRFALVDATRPKEEVVADVRRIVLRARRENGERIVRAA